jgi:thioredoxin reductase
MNTATHHDYLIIGAGPAGLQLGYFLAKQQRDYLILEAAERPGAFFAQFPRHGQLISINKVYTGYEDAEVNLRWDWNSLLSDDERMLFKNYSKDYFPKSADMVRYLSDYAEHFDLNIQCNTRIVQVHKDERFHLRDSQGNDYTCKRLIIATGVSKPYLPPIPGVELAEPYTDVSVDPADFINQRVLIIGKGNSAFETADNLIATAAMIHVASPHPLKLAWQSHFVGHLRAVNNNFLDTYQLKSQNAVLDATIERIERQNGQYVVSVSYSHANGEQEKIIYDRVIACTGFRFDASIFDETCRPELTIHNRFPVQTSEWESVNVPDLYFAGTITQSRDYKKSTSGFIHGFRYNVALLHHILEHKYHGQPWQSHKLPATAESLTQALLQRVNGTSALWQQYGFIGDLIVVDEDEQQATYYPELPVDYVHDSALGQEAHYYLVTLEFGKILGDPFAIERNPDPTAAAQSTFLHPVIRRFAGSTLLAEHHVLENLFGEWQEAVHTAPLHDFFAQQLHAQQLYAQPLFA